MAEVSFDAASTQEWNAAILEGVRPHRVCTCLTNLASVLASVRVFHSISTERKLTWFKGCDSQRLRAIWAMTCEIVFRQIAPSTPRTTWYVFHTLRSIQLIQCPLERWSLY